MAGVQELTPALGASAACRALGLWRGAPARRQARLRGQAFVGPPARRATRPRPPLALDANERQALLDTLNGERFVDLLRLMMKGRRKPIHLIVDGLPAHKTLAVRAYVESLKGKLTLHFLPGYAPDLNFFGSYSPPLAA